MKTYHLFAFALVLISLIYAANDETAEPKIPGPIAPAEESALQKKQIEEFEAAVSKLPDFDLDRAEFIFNALQSIEYPAPFEVLESKLGRRDSLVWCCLHGGVSQQEGLNNRTDTFLVSKKEPNGGSYEIIVNYVAYPDGQRPALVARAKLCYKDRFGGFYSFDPTLDLFYPNAQTSKPEPNK